jgi:hypothetical protein
LKERYLAILRRVRIYHPDILREAAVHYGHSDGHDCVGMWDDFGDMSPLL